MNQTPAKRDTLHSIETLRTFIQPHLDRVSRSFAHGIRQLEPRLGISVGLSYLICRLLDTVEDAPWSGGSAQELAFQTFEAFMKVEPTASQVDVWISAFPVSLPEGEALLLAESHRVFQEFHFLPESERDVILAPVLSMCRGMSHFMRRKQMGGALELESLGEVQTYCFFVAGLVGEILTGLVREKSRASMSGLTYLRGGHFGLFLQKVNILKDQREDEAEGRKLVPSRAEVMGSLRMDAREAMNYLESIPLELKSYRVFCAWALLLGLASLPAIELGWRSGRSPKLPRIEAMWLAQKIESRISNPDAVRLMYDELFSVAFADQAPLSRDAIVAAPIAIDREVLKLYSGRMSEADLLRLLTVS